MSEDQKYTLDEAREKLKTEGYTVMKQKAFDDILDEKYGKGFNKGKEEASTALSDEQKQWKKSHDELPGVKRKLEDATKDKPDMISKSEHEALLKVEQDKNTKHEEAISGLKRHQLDNELLKTFGTKAVDPSDVLALTRGQFQLGDDGKIFPVNEKGEKLIDGEGHVSPERFFDKFFKDKPHFAKAANSQGAGSGTNGEGNHGGSGKSNVDALVKMDDAALSKSLGLPE